MEPDPPAGPPTEPEARGAPISAHAASGSTRSRARSLPRAGACAVDVGLRRRRIVGAGVHRACGPPTTLKALQRGPCAFVVPPSAKIAGFGPVRAQNGGWAGAAEASPGSAGRVRTGIAGESRTAPPPRPARPTFRRRRRDRRRPRPREEIGLRLPQGRQPLDRDQRPAVAAPAGACGGVSRRRAMAGADGRLVSAREAQAPRRRCPPCAAAWFHAATRAGRPDPARLVARGPSALGVRAPWRSRILERTGPAMELHPRASLRCEHGHGARRDRDPRGPSPTRRSWRASACATCRCTR